MATLRELTAEFGFFQQELIDAGGEISPEIETRLAHFEASLTTKADSIAYVLDHLDAEAIYWKAKASDMQKLARSFSNAHERLKDRVKFAMRKMGATEIKGDEQTFSLSDSRKKLVIFDQEKVPDSFLKETIVTEPDKYAIESSLKAGIEVPGCMLEPVYMLRVKYSLKKKE